MCGRFLLTATEKMITDHFQLDPGSVRAIPPRYNIAPSTPILVVHTIPANGRRLEAMLWGLIPAWSRDPKMGARLINARSETVQEKPSFRAAYKRRRCLIPSSGFYEWHVESGHKQPYYVTVADAPVFAFAGLWEHWVGADGSEIRTATILTTDANVQMRAIHERMPVIIKPDDYEEWLTTRETEAKKVAHLMQPYDGELDMYPVSTAVNNPRNEGAGLINGI